MYSDSAIVTPTGEVSALRVETHRVNIALCVLCVCVEIVVRWCVSVCVCAYWRRRKGSACDDLVR